MSRRGDELVPDANMVFDRARTVQAPPGAVWPWLAQLGKNRADWYLPRRVERWLPPSRRALRHVEPAYQQLQPGDRIPDYGGRHAALEVAEIVPPRALVYRDERRGASFSWAITLDPVAHGTATIVRLRFRGRIKSTGVRRRLIVAVGGCFDGLTGEAMLRGLAERVTPS